ncbi:hypothetical protein TCSYLVIO_001903 [Trypanosoma cruzi]|nr:hypothetical protein TCSYLVIO_001903 [Trypanosoma cruzi]
MLEGPDCLQLDENVLEALVHALTADRSFSVEDCLPYILNEIAHGESDVGAQRRRGTRGRWEHAKAAEVAESLGRALNSRAGGKEWSAAEDGWNMFLCGIGSGRRANGEVREALRALVGPATQALAPVLEFLVSEENVHEDRLLCARGFYARAVSSLLRVHLPGATEKECVMWLRRCDWKKGLEELLSPFLQCEVEPLAKELAFHFQQGMKTARREEPQHFFSFLLQLYERYNADVRTHGWTSPNMKAQDSISLLALGSVSLAFIAVSVFRGVYGWCEGSQFLASRDFTVHGVNSFIEFLDRARGIIHGGAQLLLAESIFFHSAFCVFLETAKVAAERSFTTGARALWRQEFLAMDPPRAFHTVCGAYHMLRCLEAVVRRLGVVFSLLPTYAVSLWERTITPCLSTFVCVCEAAKESCDSNLDAVMVSLEVLSCAHAMHSAAEEWMEQCCEVCGGVEISTSSLERLALWRDELTRGTTHDVKQFLARLFAEPGLLEWRDLQAWDALLRVVCSGKTPAHAVVYEDMKLSLTRLISEEQRNSLKEYCQVTSMGALATLLGKTVT